jgi:hypothetical protein
LIVKHHLKDHIMRATDGTIRLRTFPREIRRRAAPVAAASLAFALALTLFLLQRRATGALAAPLPVMPLLVTGIAAALWAIAVRELAPRNSLAAPLALVTILLLALACSLPGTRIIDWLVWPTAMFAVVLIPRLSAAATAKSRFNEHHTSPKTQFAEQLEERGGWGSSAANAPVHWGVAEPSSQPPPHHSSVKIGLARQLPEDAPTDDPESPQVLQQLTRLRTADGHESIHGTLTAEFSPGERQTTLHVAFCPPFEAIPEVEVNIADDSDATVKLTQLLHHGAQLELRLPEPAEDPLHITIEFSAT